MGREGRIQAGKLLVGFPFQCLCFCFIHLFLVEIEVDFWMMVKWTVGKSDWLFSVFVSDQEAVLAVV